MAALKPPFEGRDLEELFKSVQNRTVPNIPRQYSKELMEFIHLCLNKKAGKRLSAC